MFKSFEVFKEYELGSNRSKSKVELLVPRLDLLFLLTSNEFQKNQAKKNQKEFKTL
jgi:hypothetical protein